MLNLRLPRTFDQSLFTRGGRGLDAGGGARAAEGPLGLSGGRKTPRGTLSLTHTLSLSISLCLSHTLYLSFSLSLKVPDSLDRLFARLKAP